MQSGGCSGWYLQVGTVDLLFFVCWLYMSFAMSSGLVNMLLDSSVMQSSGGDSVVLKTRMCILFGVMSYVCLYFDMAFVMLSFVNAIVIFLASLLAFLAMLARLCIHSSGGVFGGDGGGIIVCLWL